MLKHLKRFLTYLHSLSEEARKLLALAATAVFSIFILSLWMGNTSSNLQSISLPNPALGPHASALHTEKKDAPALGPTAGIAESLRSLEFVIPEVNPKSAFGSIEMNDAYDYYNQTEKSAKKFLASIYETVYGWADKIGRKIYTP